MALGARSHTFGPMCLFEVLFYLPHVVSVVPALCITSCIACGVQRQELALLIGPK
jgi:hypothetical protein